ncbi:DUF935 family protein [Lacibacter luteus]|uniref:DUF935 family protein n=1 Tax=Lacibacter luteus TaxID=2508719 RepID=A0A4Q1CD92_9BACT|nr:DUF935 family protein [Lacibacter luteus]RXK57558.1 DUF935 family protein [Lacibacter luteus]
MAKVKRVTAPEQQKVVVTMTELILQTIDRSRADISKWWNSLQRAEQISYPNRTNLYDLYERIILDGHLTGIMDKRVKSVKNKKLHYKVNGNSVKELDDLIKSIKFREFIELLFEKKSHGLVGFEFTIGTGFDYQVIPRKHIKPEAKIIATEQNGWTGTSYEGVWNVMVLEDIKRFGFLLRCCPYAILKSGSLSDLAQYIELYGQPIRVGKYDAADVETKKELKRALKEAGASLSITIPSQAQIEIIGDNVTNGNGEVHKVMFNTCNNEMSIVVLGNTETTSNDNGGSNAKSKEHGKQQKEIHKDDIAEMANILSSDAFKVILQSYGYPVAPGDGGSFVFEMDIDLDELKTKSEIWSVVSAKVPVADDDWYTTFNIPKPANYDAMRKKMDEEKAAQQQPAPAPTPTRKPKPKVNNQAFEEFEELEDDEPIVKRVKGAARAFLQRFGFFE